MPRVGYKMTDEQKKVRSEALRGRFTGESHPNWTGDKPKYWAVHTWVHKKYGNATKCEFADNTCSTHYEWSNKSREYFRDRSDWQELCVSHHRRYDGHMFAVQRKGEDVGTSKLSEAQVKQIRQLYAQGDYSQRRLASRFTVTQANIYNIVNRHTWTHI